MYEGRLGIRNPAAWGECDLILGDNARLAGYAVQVDAGPATARGDVPGCCESWCGGYELSGTLDAYGGGGA